MLRSPRGDQPDREHERRQHDEPDAEPVHADEVGKAHRRHPVHLLDELIARPLGIERSEHAHRDDEVGGHHDERQPLRPRVSHPLPQQEDGDPDQRQEDEDAQPGHGQNLSPRYRRSAAAPSRKASAYERTYPDCRTEREARGLADLLGDLVDGPVDDPVIDRSERPPDPHPGRPNEPRIQRVDVERVREPGGELGLALGESRPVHAPGRPHVPRDQDRQHREDDRDADEDGFGEPEVPVLGHADHRLEEPLEEAALRLETEDESAQDRSRREDHERGVHRPRRLVGARIAALGAEEREEQRPRDVQGGKERADRRHDPRRDAPTLGGEIHDVVLGEEPRERRDAGQGERADREQGGRDGHLLPQAAHPAHVGLVVEPVQDVARRQEQQRLVEGVADEQEHGAGVEPHPGREEHEPDLTHRRVRERPLDVELADRGERGVDRGDEPDDEHHRERDPRCLEQGVRSHDQVDAGGHHRRRMDQRGDGRRSFHRIREPDVQRDLRGLADGTGEEQQRDRGERGLGRPGDGRRVRPDAEHRAEVQRSEVHEDQDDPEHHRGVADPGRDERLLRRARGARSLVPEADQQVGAQPDALPAEVEQEVIVREDEDQHEEDEQVQVGEEAFEARIAVHVADRVDVDQGTDAGDDQHHGEGQRIDQERDPQTEAPGIDPREQLDDVLALLGGQREEVEQDGHADREGEPDRCRCDPSCRLAKAPPEEQVHRRPCQRQRGDQPRLIEHRITPARRSRRRRSRSGGADRRSG